MITEEQFRDVYFNAESVFSIVEGLHLHHKNKTLLNAKISSFRQFVASLNNTNKEKENGTMKKETKKTAKQTKKEPVTIANYQRLAMKTCLTSCKNNKYLRNGMLSEQAEYFAKFYGKEAKKIRGDFDTEKQTKIDLEIKQEIGDLFWFVALGCTLNRIKFEDVFKKAKSNLNFVTIAVPLYGVSDKKFGRESVKTAMSVAKSLCKHNNFKPSDCLRMNIAKLADRKKRNVIKGNGDNR